MLEMTHSIAWEAIAVSTLGHAYLSVKSAVPVHCETAKSSLRPVVQFEEPKWTLLVIHNY
jgi:hypothetical protein